MNSRFVNPHLLQQATQTVSRADLWAEQDVSHPDVEEDDAAVSTLERILKRSLGDFHNDHTELTQDTERRKKRKKVRIQREGDEEAEPLVEEQPIEFRLFSKATKLVSLKPKPPPQIIVTGPSLEDDDDEAALRANRARAVAVDASWIFEESQRLYSIQRAADSPLMLSADEPFTPAPFMVFELPRPILPPTPPTDGQPSAFRKAPTKERPSPHEFPPDKICCSVVSAVLSQTEPSSHQRKRRSRTRHKKPSAEPKPPPSFWRPLQEWGGKSRGYALGYEGSRPVPTGSVRQWRYRRDIMKKATFCV